MVVEIFRGVSIFIIIIFSVLYTKYIKWINKPEFQLFIGLALILAILADSISGILLTIAFIIAFGRVNNLVLFHIGNDSASDAVSSSRLQSPFVTAKNLEDAQNNVFNSKEFNSGYKPASNKNGFGAQGLDPVSGTTNLNDKPVYKNSDIYNVKAY